MTTTGPDASAPSATADREIVISRLIQAPREQQGNTDTEQARAQKGQDCLDRRPSKIGIRLETRDQSRPWSIARQIATGVDVSRQEE